MLQDLVVAAVRQAMDEAAQTSSDELGELTGGLGGLLG
jgi:DNA-binding protein YbaB